MDEGVGVGLAAEHSRGSVPREVSAGLVFAGCVAGGAAGIGWLAGVVPIFDGAGFVGEISVRAAVGLGAWMATIALGSLALPVATLVVWGRHAEVRLALGPYLAVLLAQIAVEIVYSGAFFPDVVVFTGISFTGYRLWQLAGARRRFDAAVGPSALGPSPLGRAAVRCCLWVGLILWAANLAFLVFVALPRAVGFV